jgi:hypothetical protein
MIVTPLEKVRQGHMIVTSLKKACQVHMIVTSLEKARQGRMIVTSLKKARQGHMIVTSGVKELPVSNTVNLTVNWESRYSDWLRAGRPGGGRSSPGRVKIFTSPYRPDRPTSYKMGTGGPFPGVKRQGREADHSPTSSAEVKKMWIYTSTLIYVFMA